MTVSKEDRRRAQALKRRRKVRVAKALIASALVVITPVLIYLAMQG